MSFENLLRAQVAEIEAGCQRLLEAPPTTAFATDVRRMQQAGDLLARGAADAASAEDGARTAHRLRNPLAALIGYSEFLREDASADAAAELDRIHRAAERLLALVEREFG